MPEPTTRTEALDVDRCAYDNCYDDVYGVVQGMYFTEIYEVDTGTLGTKKHIFFVNTPLCKVHYHQVPAMAYIWENKDHENLE